MTEQEDPGSWIHVFHRQYDEAHGPYQWRNIYEVDEELFIYADALIAESKRRKQMTQHLPRDHPEVASLLAQLQVQYGSIGKVSSFVGCLNVDDLRTELYERGWNTRLAEDEVTVVLVPVEKPE